MTVDETPVYEPGDVIYGADPYKGEQAARPWLVISNHEGKPFHGEQYIALSLTTRTWMDGLIDIDEDGGFAVALLQRAVSSRGRSNRS